MWNCPSKLSMFLEIILYKDLPSCHVLFSKLTFYHGFVFIYQVAMFLTWACNITSSGLAYHMDSLDEPHYDNQMTHGPPDTSSVWVAKGPCCLTTPTKISRAAVQRLLPTLFVAQKAKSMAIFPSDVLPPISSLPKFNSLCYANCSKGMVFDKLIRIFHEQHLHKLQCQQVRLYSKTSLATHYHKLIDFQIFLPMLYSCLYRECAVFYSCVPWMWQGLGHVWALRIDWALQ